MNNRATVEELDNVSEAAKWMLSGGNANMISWENVAVSLGAIRKQHAKLVDALDLFVHAYETSATPEKLSGNLNSIVIDKARAALAASRGQR